MIILHTADWHVGKRLGRYDRMDDFAAVLDEIVATAEREAVDAVLVAGDLFDRAVPAIDALRLAIETLERLARGRPVVAIAGNHDSGDLFDVLAPLLRSRGVHLIGTPRAPEEGGLVTIQTAAGPAHIGCLPFVRDGQLVNFLDRVERWRGAYREQIAALCQRFGQALVAAAEATPGPTVLMGHFAVEGVRLGDASAPRGERALHLGAAYSARGATLPPTVDYVAMGHIHAPQPVPGATTAAAYAGSPLALDFGEVGENKQVRIVELAAGQPATSRSVPLRAGRRLRHAHGSWNSLIERAELREAFVDLSVVTAGPDPGLADRAREAFPYLVKVRAEYPRQVSDPAQSRATRAWDDLYAEYHRQAHESDPDPDLLNAFRAVLDDVLDAPA